MSSKPSLIEALATTEHDLDLGPVTTSITDGLIAIAAAINHLALVNERLVVVQEATQARLDQRSAELRGLFDMIGRGDMPSGGGHA